MVVLLRENTFSVNSFKKGGGLSVGQFGKTIVFHFLFSKFVVNLYHCLMIVILAAKHYTV